MLWNNAVIRFDSLRKTPLLNDDFIMKTIWYKLKTL